MLYTHKQMEREIDRRLHEEFLRRATEEELSRLCKRVQRLEDRVHFLECKVFPENCAVARED